MSGDRREPPHKLPSRRELTNSVTIGGGLSIMALSSDLVAPVLGAPQAGPTNPETASGSSGPESTSCNSVAALRGTSLDQARLFVPRYHPDADGGGGVFELVKAPQAGRYVDNGGTVIVPSGGDGSIAWVRVLDTPISVRMFGARGDGISDDTAAFKRAVDFVEEASQIIIPRGTYLISDTIRIAKQRIVITGEKMASIIRFAPQNDSECFLFDSGRDALFQAGIANLVFESGDDKFRKTAIKLVDVSSFFVDTVHTRSPHWYGRSSIFLHICGRDTTHISNIVAFADRPIVISPIPQPHEAANIGIDHFSFNDIYIGNDKSPEALITIEADVPVSHVSFGGFQAWVGGRYGLYWEDHKSSTASMGLSLRNVRWEQTATEDGWFIFINVRGPLYQFRIEDSYGALTKFSGLPSNGIYLANVELFEIRNYMYLGDKIALQLNSGCRQGDINIFANNPHASFRTSSCIALSGMYRKGGNVHALSPNAPSGAGLTQLWNPSKTLGFNQLEPRPFTLPRRTSPVFSTDELLGLVFVTSNVGAMAIISVAGRNHSTRVLGQTSIGWYGSSPHEAKINLYWDDVKASYILQNATESDIEFHVTITGRGER